MFPQLGQIPAIATENPHGHAALDHGIDLAGDGEDQGRFPTAIGPEDGDMLAGADGEVHVVQDDAVASRDVDIPQFEKLIRIKRQLGFGWAIG